MTIRTDNANELQRRSTTENSVVQNNQKRNKQCNDKTSRRDTRSEQKMSSYSPGSIVYQYVQKSSTAPRKSYKSQYRYQHSYALMLVVGSVPLAVEHNSIIIVYGDGSGVLV